MIEPKIDFNRYSDDVETLEIRDEPIGKVVFYGSSTFTFWGHDRLKKDMTPIDVVNRGFGGSTAHDALNFYERLVKPIEPKTLVWYEGDNDLAVGYTPEETLTITTMLFEKIRMDFSGIKFIILSVKESPCRRELWQNIKKYNSLAEEYASNSSDVLYMDIKTTTHDEKGKAREDIYLEDGLHFNEKGYSLLAEQVKKTLMPLV